MAAGLCILALTFLTVLKPAEAINPLRCPDVSPGGDGAALARRIGPPASTPTGGVCSAFDVNPCGTGQCLEDTVGGYLCSCAPGFVLGADTSGQQVCVAAGSGKGGIVHTVRPGEGCASVAEAFSMSVSDLQALNNGGLDCAAAPSLAPGHILLVQDLSEVAPSAPVLGCGQAVRAAEGDTCEALRERFGVADGADEFAAYNRGLECAGGLAEGQQVCIRGALTDSSVGNGIRCGAVYGVKPDDSCCSVAQAQNASIADFLGLNQGIDCDKLRTDQEVCVSHFDALAPLVTCHRYYYVQAGDTCPSIWTRFGISGTTFLALNVGLICNELQVGIRVCVG